MLTHPYRLLPPLIYDVWQDIEVPETLLKKRKQNEKAREERLEKATASRKVRFSLSPPFVMHIHPGKAIKTMVLHAASNQPSFGTDPSHDV
jgi:hypothetical protein